MENTHAVSDGNTHAGRRTESSEQQQHLVASLELFLHAWAEGDRAGSNGHMAWDLVDGDTTLHAAARIGTELPMSTSVEDYLAPLPPRLPAPLPRSFRPHEMVPAVYLGSWNDIGTDVQNLARRIADVSKSTYKTSVASLPSCRPRQRLLLVVRACPLKGCFAPRLELHVTRRRPRGRRPLLSRGDIDPSLPPVAASRTQHSMQKPSQQVLATQRGQRPRATTPSEPDEEDVVVASMPLSDVYKRVCTAAVAAGEALPPATDAVLANGATSSGIGAIATWLTPDSPLSSPSRSPLSGGARAGDVPADCTPADWQVYVRATQCLLSEGLLAHTPTSTALERDVSDNVDAGASINLSETTTTITGFSYWRLVLPILDSPGTRIQHYTPMTSLIMHAALTLEAHPRGHAWLQGLQREMPSRKVSESINRSIDDVTKKGGDACEQIDSCTARSESATAETRTVYPCVAVHCQAGKSRSVTFVAAFLMHQWMWWYRGCHPHRTADLLSSTSQQQPQQHNQNDNTARRLVDTVLSYLRRRRLCIDINLGFDTQLWEMGRSFLRSL